MEFSDRFGPLPEDVINLFYQVRVRLLADAAGVVSVSLENNQVALRYPPQPENAPPRQFPYIGPDVRPGKNTLWMPVAGQENWQERLLQVLEALI